ncbi:MAG: thioredoxin [Paucibacter sp.]|nr:thioredoxin [Roseateles sp.]
MRCNPYDPRVTENLTVLHVACLCAAWCRLCDDYAPVLERTISELELPGVKLRGHWIDIEDEAELVGDVDVETFPTIVVIGPEGVRFAGPVLPHADTLGRLLRNTAEPPTTNADPEYQAFAQRLRART